MSISVLESFVKKVPNFEELEPKEVVPYIIYFLTTYENRKCVGGAEINNCLIDLDMGTYANISVYLSNSTRGNPPKLVRHKENGKVKGYKLERKLKNKIKAEVSESSDIEKIKSSLRDHLPPDIDGVYKEFWEESINCFESKFFRSAIVMAWCATIYHLFMYIHSNKENLRKFNDACALNGKHKNRKIKNIDDFSEITENDFLLLCRTGKVIGKNPLTILNQCLKTRNIYAHPNDTKLTMQKCSSFISDLLDNVVNKYPLD